MIAGLCYLPKLDQRVHDDLIVAADRERWLMWDDHRVQVYGYGYNRAKDVAFHMGDLPLWTTDLAERLWHDGLLPDVPDQLVVNDPCGPTNAFNSSTSWPQPQPTSNTFSPGASSKSERANRLTTRK